jgi:Rad3-related DNA helicase
LDHLIRHHFPYAEFFPGQYEAIEQAIKHFRSGKKFVMAQVPTGVGKSAIAYTIHHVLRELDAEHRSTFVTVTKSLQDQYVREFDDIFDLKGKTNYECLKKVGPYNSQGCREALVSERCSRKICPYVQVRDEWCDVAPLKLTNTSFMVEACDLLVMKPENRSKLIVVDECHTLDTHLVKHCTLGVEVANLQYTMKIAGQAFTEKLLKFFTQFYGVSVGDVIDSAAEKAKNKVLAARELHIACSSNMSSWDESLRSGKGSGSMAAAVEELQQITDKLDIFVKARGEWIVQETTPSKKIVLMPVYAHSVAQHGIFRKADQFLLMSATICGFEEYARSLGLDEKDYAIVDIPSPIPKEQRPVYACDLMKVAGDFDTSMLVKYIDKLIKREKGNGIIHTVSYKLAQEIIDSSRYSERMLIHRDMKQTMEHLKRGDAIILSPSMEQGYDFKGDLARWQIIAKHPYDYLGDPWIKLNTSRSSSWYRRRGVLRVVQASGRAVRGVSDWANTYVIDSEFSKVMKENRDLFPDWFRESVVRREDIPFLR